MSHSIEFHSPASDHLLLRDLARSIAVTLHAVLPPPQDDTPEAWALRDRLAIARVNALGPASIEEGDIAAHYIACLAHADDCMRLSVRRGAEAKEVAQQRAQQGSMGREARGYRGLLTRLQAARCKAAASNRGSAGHGGMPEADAAATDTTATELAGLLTQAVESLPPTLPAPPEPLPPAEEAPPRPLAWSDLTEEEQQKSLLWQEADRYAICHTARVKRIRLLGGLPPDCDYEPPRPEILDMIIHGETSNLIWADSYQSWVPPPTG